jgi:AraC-like DNA-binding protein
MAQTNAAKNQARAEALRTALVRKITDRMHEEGVVETHIPGLMLYRRSEPTVCGSAAYEPRLIVFVQGKKRINIGTLSYLCDGTSFLLNTIDVPVVSQVVSASKKEPILGLLLRIDLAEVRRILNEQEMPAASDPVEARGMAVGVTTAEMLDACVRLMDLLDASGDAGFLGRLMQQEILYRVLHTPQGKYLRAIATLGEQSNRTAKVVTWLRANYAKPLRIEELAEMARMGVSTLHHHFRSLTAMSPLQYQKQLRLHVARERMLHEGLDAASAAFEVGYESASQFSREYRRFFGEPPMRDVKASRAAGLLPVSE